MLKKGFSVLLITLATLLTGCASVPMASVEEDLAKKQFSAPPPHLAGLYIYRNSNFGAALKKNILIDGQIIGESAPMTYFYKELEPGTHQLSTESEFSDNALTVAMEAGKNYFVKQYIKMGVFVGGANLEPVDEIEGKNGVLECKLAKENPLLSQK
ncbi:MULTISPECIES: DUF2846 domain-containing protein [unclassified Neptuniibacter]|uniref:DUF2846 domain-containing protein n=1 Tax=unclassified Neptuniibacter TaxID=2630693 RepID=UPI000C585C56|nr:MULTISPECIES: DUF2846 domain-containing protein [unclassified Neptuniibacter]MAY41654.1 hypothetical protein [Oceanospirillaceae bacterium]|tara:strand:- start:8984 stop:9451 length:468 start_codon:yes stop_codon:yes gene_type:complete